MSIHSLAFNQSTTLLSCGTSSGIIIYKLNPSIEKQVFVEQNGGVGNCKILDNTNIFTIVGGSDTPCKPKNIVVLWDDKEKKSEIEINLKEPVRNTLLTRDENHKIIIILEKKIFTFDFHGINHGNKDTYCNERGLCVISDKDSLIIATLGLKKGEIAIWNLKSDSYKTIEAHSNNIEAIAINMNGSLVATASEMGTNIHIFNTNTSKLLYKFKRGTFSSKIFDISFNWNSSIIACTSANGTIHMFELYKEEEQTQNSRSILSKVSPYLPNYLGKSYFSSHWGFIQIDVETNSKTICSFDEKNVLHVVSYTGDYFKIWGQDYKKIEKSRLHTNNK